MLAQDEQKQTQQDEYAFQLPQLPFCYHVQQQSRRILDSRQRTYQALTFSYKITPPRSQTMPDLSSLVVINETRAYTQGMPICLISLSTNSGECRNIAPYFLYLHNKFPGIYFLQISYQPYDNIISTYANIPELLQLNVSHDASFCFKRFLSDRAKLAIPHLFIFNIKKCLVHDGHPMSKQIESVLMRMNGSVYLEQRRRCVSPSRISEWKQRGLTQRQCSSVLRSWKPYMSAMKVEELVK